MLDAVIRWSLRYRSLVLLLAVGTLAYGGYLATTMPIDVFPDLDRPRVVIVTECPGMSPEEVETVVAQPVETRLLGATGVQAVRSQATLGLSIIFVEFDWRADIRAARQVVAERLATLAGDLPERIRPQMTPPSSIMGQMMIVGLHRRHGPRGGELYPVGDSELVLERTDTGAADRASPWLAWRVVDRRDVATWQAVAIDRWTEVAPERDPGDRDRRLRVVVAGRAYEVPLPTPLQQQIALRSTADWLVRPRLLQIPGVAEVLVLGGERKQYQVLVDPDALLEYDVTLHQVAQAVAANNRNASGGFTTEGAKERPIRVLGRLGPSPHHILHDLRRLPVKTQTDRHVLLEHVARIEVGAEPKRGDAAVDGLPGVVITVVKQPHTDTRLLTEQVTRVLRDLETTLPVDLAINTQLFQLRSFIDRGMYYVGEALLLGAGLVIVVLFLFLFNFRTTFITLTAIPLSLAVTTIVFRLIGLATGRELSINVMTLGGLAVAMGELVDDAIVDVENIYRRLRENWALPQPRPALCVVYEASREIRSAIVFGTMVVILVFLPLFALSGIEGRLFAPLGVAYIVSILASLAVSLTVTPVLSYFLLGRPHHQRRLRETLVVRGLKWAAARVVRFSMNHAGKLLAGTWLGVALAAWQLTRLGSDFLPPFDEGSIQLNVTLPPGASLEASRQVAEVIDARLRAMRKTLDRPQGEILHFIRRTGRAEFDEHADPVSRSEYILSVNPQSGRTRAELLEQLLRELRDELPGVDLEAEQPLAHLISHMLSGVSAQIAIRIYGDDLTTLRRLAQQAKAAIRGVPGLTTPVIEPQVLTDELHVVLRPDDLAHFGVSRAMVADFVATAVGGAAVSRVLEGPRQYDLVVKLPEPQRSDVGRLRELRLELPDGRGHIRLGDVADFPEAAAGPNQLFRENARRRAVIRCNVLGRDLGSAVAEIEERLRRDLHLPVGYTVEFGGQFESQRAASRLIAVLAGVALVGIFVLLLILHPSVRIVLQILNAIPTAFIGGVVALACTGQSLTVASLVGFVSLGGIAVRNGILLVTHYFHLMKEEGEAFTPALVLRGSLERLAPVLMTALTAGIAL
ncbi:MAG: efflux RND transporter permease subunit, partial [Gemmataceae bacterium]|nr:efflux RND transporter permease subunit [Gemmataceae bacterium]